MLLCYHSWSGLFRRPELDVRAVPEVTEAMAVVPPIIALPGAPCRVKRTSGSSDSDSDVTPVKAEPTPEIIQCHAEEPRQQVNR